MLPGNTKTLVDEVQFIFCEILYQEEQHQSELTRVNWSRANLQGVSQKRQPNNNLQYYKLTNLCTGCFKKIVRNLIKY